MLIIIIIIVFLLPPMPTPLLSFSKQLCNSSVSLTCDPGSFQEDHKGVIWEDREGSNLLMLPWRFKARHQSDPNGGLRCTRPCSKHFPLINSISWETLWGRCSKKWRLLLHSHASEEPDQCGAGKGGGGKWFFWPLMLYPCKIIKGWSRRARN